MESTSCICKRFFPVTYLGVPIVKGNYRLHILMTLSRQCRSVYASGITVIFQLEVTDSHRICFTINAYALVASIDLPKKVIYRLEKMFSYFF